MGVLGVLWGYWVLDGVLRCVRMCVCVCVQCACAFLCMLIFVFVFICVRACCMRARASVYACLCERM